MYISVPPIWAEITFKQCSMATTTGDFSVKPRQQERRLHTAPNRAYSPCWQLPGWSLVRCHLSLRHLHLMGWLTFIAAVLQDERFSQCFLITNSGDESVAWAPGGDHSFLVVPISGYARKKYHTQVAICPNNHEVHIYEKSWCQVEQCSEHKGHNGQVTGIDWTLRCCELRHRPQYPLCADGPHVNTHAGHPADQPSHLLEKKFAGVEQQPAAIPWGSKMLFGELMFKSSSICDWVHGVCSLASGSHETWVRPNSRLIIPKQSSQCGQTARESSWNPDRKVVSEGATVTGICLDSLHVNSVSQSRSGGGQGGDWAWGGEGKCLKFCAAGMDGGVNIQDVKSLESALKDLKIKYAVRNAALFPLWGRKQGRGG
ncbi:LOW QUALITY PROTEIN: hypothetical protein U0070_010892 [Myodes glareolus]|uniref:Uncharacterized protein n=1 Tax=Myodes glareolus TaxID=447135 RepID=A0AAW0HZ95_MYOGA